MNTSNLTIPAAGRGSSSPKSGYNTSEFWERFWRTSGIQSVALLVIAYVVSGYPPPLGAPGDALVAFYCSSWSPQCSRLRPRGLEVTSLHPGSMSSRGRALC